MPVACRTASSRSTSWLPSAAWSEARHPLYGFMVETFHPDLQLFQRPAPALQRQRAVAAPTLAVA